LRSGFNSLILDNYHFISQHTYPGDVAFSNDCTQTFEIHDYNPNILGVYRNDGRLLSSTLKCLGFDLGSTCTSGTSATPADVTFYKNEEWAGINKLLENRVSVKQWQAPTGYINSVVNKLGLLPKGSDEIAEGGTYGDTSDDYLWADWNTGVEVPTGIPGISKVKLKKPTTVTTMPNVYWATTETNKNLIQSSAYPSQTKEDFFLTTRGFIKVTEPAYYVFGVETGNTGTADSSQQIALLSVKHNTKYTLDEINALESLDDITFKRDNTDKVSTIGTTATGTFNLYGKNGEYGIVEIRQNETYSDSGHYYLEPGYYAIELKASYGSSEYKKLKLYWQAYQANVGDTIKFENIIPKKIIPSSNFVTIQENNFQIEDTLGKGYMDIPSSLIEGGDVFNVVYRQSSDSNSQISGFISSDDKSYENLDIHVRINNEALPDNESSNRTSPQKTFMVLFRAKSKNKDVYSNIDDYYTFKVDGKHGQISLSKVQYSSELQGPIIHKLNLNKKLNEKDQQLYNLQLVDENNHAVEFEDGIYYDILLKIRDDKLSAYYKKNAKFSDAVASVYTNISQDVTKYVDDQEYEEIFTDILLSQSDADVSTTDWNGNKLSIAQRYVYESGAGAYGFAVKSSIIKLEKFIVKSYDNVDETLISTENKWKTVKPKYLDSRNRNLLKYNSYGLKNQDQAMPPIFTVEVTGAYNNLDSVLPIENNLQLVTDNNVQSLLVSNLKTNDWGTRLNIVFNKNWIENRFNTVEEVLNSIIIPYGNFQQPYINWLAPSSNQSEFETYVQAGYYPNLSENERVSPHTVAVSGNAKIYLTDLSRNSDDYSLLKLFGPLATILESTNSSVYNGVWEEVCPLSTEEYWSGTKYKNEAFELIYKDIATKDQIIGAKFINDTALGTAICKSCENSVLWGLYEISFPEYMVENQEEYRIGSIATELISPMRYFVPIGKISKTQTYLLPPPELLKNENIEMHLKGIFVHVDMEQITLIDKTTIKLNKQNAWEEKYKYKLKCKYHLDVSTSFFAKLDSYNKYQLISDSGTVQADKCVIPETVFNEDDECKVVPNAFYMPKSIINLLTYVESSSINFDADYDWWVPRTVWVSKNGKMVLPENDDTLLFTGLNAPNKFYSDEEITKNGGFDYILNDKLGVDTGKYMIDTKWCVSSVSWDAEYSTVNKNSSDVGTFDPAQYVKVGFLSGSKGAMGYESVVQIGEYINATIPMTTVATSGVNLLHFGDYYEDDTGVSKTLSPYGLFNWYQTHSSPITEPNQNRIGWDNTDWNEQFNKCFRVQKVLGEVSPSVFEINKYWSFYQDKITPFGTIISINISPSKCYSLDSYIPDTKMVIGISDGKNAFMQIPAMYSYYPKWNRCIDGIYVDNFVIPSDSYYITTDVNTGKSKLVLDTQGNGFDYSSILSENTKILINFYSDKLVETETDQEERIVDNFRNIREINWVTMVEDNGIYKIAPRQADDNLLFTGESFPYNIVEYKGEKAYQLSNKFATENTNGFSGVGALNNTVGINSNNGSIDVLQLIDTPSTTYTVEADVLFDEKIIEEDYDKRFDLILKAETNYVKGNEWGVVSYYFVGIGAYNFDLSLGMRTVDLNTGEVKETFLASFGEFNTRNIKVGTWYTVKADVSRTRIKVFLYERGTAPQLALNYNIDKKYEKLSERYLKGQYETLEAIVEGLNNLLITYPNKLGDTVSAKFTFDNFKEELAKTLPVNGHYSGFKTFNTLTYVSRVLFTSKTPKQYKWGSTLDIVSLNDIIEEIKRTYGLPSDPDVKKIKKTLNFTTYVLINDTLYYKENNGFIQKYSRPVYDFDTVENKIFVVEKIPPTDAALGMNSWDIGDHSFVWSLNSNVHNIQNSQDFFKTVPNLTKVVVVKNSQTYTSIMSDSTCTTGTSATSGTGISGQNVSIELGDEITLSISCREVTWPLDGTIGRHDIELRVFEEGFVNEYTVLIKDKTFYKDEIKSYMDYSQKKLRKVIINDNRLNLILEDV
jgi:hypothetical protein